MRPEGKALPLLAADDAQVRAVASLASSLACRLAAHFWPGPLTLVLPARAGLHPLVTDGGLTVAVRVPGSDVARALARAAGGALVSTSANLSGGPPAVSASELALDLVAHLDGVLDGGPVPGGLPSTVVGERDGAPYLMREGRIPFAEVLRAAGG